MHVSQEVRQAVRSLKPRDREQFANSLFPSFHNVVNMVSPAASGALRRAAWADFARWRGLRLWHGRHHHHGPADAAHPLRRYYRYSQRAEVQGLGSRGPRAQRLEQASCLPRRGQGQGDTPHSATWRLGRTSHLSRRGNDHADVFAKRGADTCKPASRVATTVVACQGLETTRVAAVRPQARPPRGKTQAHDSLQLERVFDSGAKLWKTPSSFAPNVEQCIGTGGRAVPQLQRNPGGQNIAAAQIEVGAVPEQTLSCLDSGRSSSTHSRRGYLFLVAQLEILRGWSGQNGHVAYHTQKATGGSTGRGAGALGASRQGSRQR